MNLRTTAILAMILISFPLYIGFIILLRSYILLILYYLSFLEPFRHGRFGKRYNSSRSRGQRVLPAMRDIAVTIPTSLSFSYLRQHIIYLSRLHKLRIQLCMATDTVIHNHLRTGVRVPVSPAAHFSWETPLRASFRQSPWMSTSLPRFREEHDSHYKYIPGMRTMKPGCIIRRHDMAIHTCCRIISQICMCPKHIHK